MKQVVLAVFKKELKEVLRDKRTLILAIFLPLVFYPLMLGVSFSINKNKQDSLSHAPLVVNESGVPQEFKKLLKVEWRPHLHKITEGADACLTYEKGFTLIYRNSVTGERARTRLMEALGNYQQDLLLKNISSSDLPAKLLNSFKIEQHQKTLERSELAHLAGGASAYFIIFLAFTGCMSVAVDAGAGERERGTLEAMTATSASMLGIAIGKFCFILLMGGLSVLATFLGMLALLLWQDTDLETILRYCDFSTAIQLIGTLISVVIFFSSLLYGISLLAKSTREAHLRASVLLMLIVLILAVATTSTPQLWTWFIPIINTAAVIKGTIAGDLSWFHWAISLFATLSSSTLLLLLVSFIFKHSPEKSYLAD